MKTAALWLVQVMEADGPGAAGGAALYDGLAPIDNKTPMKLPHGIKNGTPRLSLRKEGTVRKVFYDCPKCNCQFEGTVHDIGWLCLSDAVNWTYVCETVAEDCGCVPLAWCVGALPGHAHLGSPIQACPVRRGTGSVGRYTPPGSTRPLIGF